MASDVSRDEFRRLQTRVDVAEREVEGEKLVTRHILEQTRRNGDDLAAIKTRLDRVERKMDGVDARVGVVDGKLDTLGAKVHVLTSTLPETVGKAIRDALREGGRKR